MANVTNFKTSPVTAPPDLFHLCSSPPLSWHRNIKVHGWFYSFLTQKGKLAACTNSYGTKPEHSIRRQMMCRKSLRWPNIYRTNETPQKKLPLKNTWNYQTFPPFFLYMSSQKVSSGKTSQSCSCVPLLPNGQEHPLDTDWEAQRGAGPHASVLNLSPMHKGISQSYLCFLGFILCFFF